MLVAEMGVDADLPKVTSKGLSTSKVNSFALSKGFAPVVELLQKPARPVQLWTGLIPQSQNETWETHS